MLRLT